MNLLYCDFSVLASFPFHVISFPIPFPFLSGLFNFTFLPLPFFSHTVPILEPSLSTSVPDHFFPVPDSFTNLSSFWPFPFQFLTAHIPVTFTVTVFITIPVPITISVLITFWIPFMVPVTISSSVTVLTLLFIFQIK